MFKPKIVEWRKCNKEKEFFFNSKPEKLITRKLFSQKENLSKNVRQNLEKTQNIFDSLEWLLISS